MNDKTICLKPQTIKIHLFDGNGDIYFETIVIKTHGNENCISIGRRDLFFDLEGNSSGSGANLIPNPIIPNDETVKAMKIDNLAADLNDNAELKILPSMILENNVPAGNLYIDIEGFPVLTDDLVKESQK